MARRDPRWLAAVLALAGLAWSATLAPSVLTWLRQHTIPEIVSAMSPDRPYIEESRECLGLFMAALAAVALGLWRPGPPPATD
ncbi:MAG: hypothetical protein R3F62_13230 [Planctomycetota bacterium]